MFKQIILFLFFCVSSFGASLYIDASLPKANAFNIYYKDIFGSEIESKGVYGFSLEFTQYSGWRKDSILRVRYEYSFGKVSFKGYNDDDAYEYQDFSINFGLSKRIFENLYISGFLGAGYASIDNDTGFLIKATTGIEYRMGYFITGLEASAGVDIASEKNYNIYSAKGYIGISF